LPISCISGGAAPPATPKKNTTKKSIQLHIRRSSASGSRTPEQKLQQKKEISCISPAEQRLPQPRKKNTATKKKTFSCISGGAAAPATPTASALLLNVLAFLVQKCKY
jgi:hypothetical protein